MEKVKEFIVCYIFGTLGLILGGVVGFVRWCFDNYPIHTLSVILILISLPWIWDYFVILKGIYEDPQGYYNSRSGL